MANKVEMLSEDQKRLKDDKFIQALTEANFNEKGFDNKTLFKSFDFIKSEYRQQIYNPKLGDDKNNNPVYIAAFNFLPALGGVLYKKIFTWSFYDPMSKAYYNEIDIRSLEDRKTKEVDGEALRDPVDDFLNYQFPHHLKGKCFEIAKNFKHNPMFFSYVYLVNDPNLPKELLNKVWVFPFKTQIYKKIQEKLFPVAEGIEKRLNVFSVVNSPRFVLKIEAQANLNRNSMMPNYTSSYFDVSNTVTLKDEEIMQIGYLNEIFEKQDYYALQEKFINALRKMERYDELIEYYLKHKDAQA